MSEDLRRAADTWCRCNGQEPHVHRGERVGYPTGTVLPDEERTLCPACDWMQPGACGWPMGGEPLPPTCTSPSYPNPAVVAAEARGYARGRAEMEAELRRHQAAVQAVRELCDGADRRGAGRVVFGTSDGEAVWVRDIRAAVAALDPKEQTDE